MGRVTFSPEVSDARGKLGDAVFSSWKGRPYLRTRVSGSNPNTAAQQASRQSLARCILLYQSLETQLKDDWDTKAAQLKLPGYNSFLSHNRAEEEAGANPLTVSLQTPSVDVMTGFNATPWFIPGTILLTWTGPLVPPDFKLYALIRLSGTDTLFLAEKDTTSIGALVKPLFGLTPGAYYDVYAINEYTPTNLFSLSVGQLHVQAQP